LNIERPTSNTENPIGKHKILNDIQGEPEELERNEINMKSKIHGFLLVQRLNTLEPSFRRRPESRNTLDAPGLLPAGAGLSSPA
jgi:hypothetical protein